MPTPSRADAIAALDTLHAYVDAPSSDTETPQPVFQDLAVAFNARLRESRRSALHTGVILNLPTDPWPCDNNDTVTEFLARAFIARGGTIWNAEERIAFWSSLRFPQWGVSLATRWREHDGDIAGVYQSLPPQPRFRDLAGQTLTFFLDTEQDVETNAGKSFSELMDADIDPINPIAFLALAHAISKPSDPTTYPAWKYWEWIGAIGRSGDTFGAAVAGAISDGLILRWAPRGASEPRDRARSALR